jgi:hypothetical protein
MSEIVYVFGNPAMPKYIKIGKTSRDDVEQRRKELSAHSGVPEPFVCLCKAKVKDAAKVEKALHKAFDCNRDNKKREFFKTRPERVIVLLEAFAEEDVTPSTQEMLDENISPEEKLAQQAFVDEINERRSRLRFSEIDIQPGKELAYKNDPKIKCRVVNDKKVEYEGEPFTLSALATKLLYGHAKPVRVQGALYFTYEDERHGAELLTVRRDRLEGERENEEPA